MSNHYEHPSKVSTWRGGEVILFPEAEDAATTVWFAYGEDDDGPLFEGLLAQPGREPHTAVIQAVPHFVAGVSLGDTVSTELSDQGSVMAVEPLTPSTYLTIWVDFPGAEDDESGDERYLALIRDLEQWSCWYDVRSPGFLAMAVPAASVEPVATYLREREEHGELRHQVGQ